MKKMMATAPLFMILLLSVAAVSTPAAMAATPEEIENAVAKGVEYLAGQQNPDGSWGAMDWVKAAYTGLVLIKLQMRAYELDKSPFDPEYPYSTNVISGWVFIFTGVDPYGNPLHALTQTLTVQDHTAGASGTLDDPDTNGNDYGIYWPGPEVYATGIVSMALEASGLAGSGRPNDGGVDFNGDGSPDTLKEIAQDAADWLAWAQGDSGNDEGGWGYSALDNQMVNDWTDNSNGGYAVLGLAAAEAFGCTVPAWVRTELDVWITTIQDTSGGTDDGGSYYNPDWFGMVNELKGGNLIFQMTFYGDTAGVLRFDAAMDYIVRHWQDMNNDPGWGYGISPSNYQAMFCLTKGLVYSGIDLIDLDGDGTPEHDWYDEFTTVLVSQQNPVDGYWYMGGYGDAVIDTAWALLTLETGWIPRLKVAKDFRFTDVDFAANPANLGTLIPQDASGNFLVNVVLSGKTKTSVSSTNPGQMYEVATVENPTTIDMKSLKATLNVPVNWRVNPDKNAPGAIVVLFQSAGSPTVTDISRSATITLTQGSSTVVCKGTEGTVNVDIADIAAAAGEPLGAGDKIFIFVKLQYGLKGQTVDPTLYACTDEDTVVVDAFTDTNFDGTEFTAEASATLVVNKK